MNPLHESPLTFEEVDQQLRALGIDDLIPATAAAQHIRVASFDGTAAVQPDAAATSPANPLAAGTRDARGTKAPDAASPDRAESLEHRLALLAKLYPAISLILRYLAPALLPAAWRKTLTVFLDTLATVLPIAAPMSPAMESPIETPTSSFKAGKDL